MVGLVFKLLFKAMIPLCIIFGIMSYLTYLNGGNPVAVFEGIGGNMMAKFNGIGESVGQLPEEVSENLKGGDKQTVYKWQDASGAWHYGEAPPDNAASLREVTLRPNENIVQSLKAPEQEAESDEAKPAAQASTQTGVASPYSPDAVKKLFEDANKLQETLEQRKLDQDALLGVKTAQ